MIQREISFDFKAAMMIYKQSSQDTPMPPRFAKDRLLGEGKPQKKLKAISDDLPAQNPISSSPQDILDSHEDGAPSKLSHSEIEPAIKTMKFRTKRGTMMGDLMKGNAKKDSFWEEHRSYFGRDVDESDDSKSEDYEASSSGRDEFDSDFDLTDSYEGKRGRKKGAKPKRGRPKQRRTTTTQPPPSQGTIKRGRGRPRKNPILPVQVPMVPPTIEYNLNEVNDSMEPLKEPFERELSVNCEPNSPTSPTLPNFKMMPIPHYDVTIEEIDGYFLKDD